MATIDYKQKIKDYMNSSEVDTLYKSMLNNLFPELKDSEDEKIRKAIHVYLDWLDGIKDYAPKGEYTIRDMIAWLEKQGGQKPAELPKGEDYGIDGLYHAIRILEETIGSVDGYQSDDGILEHKCAISAIKKLYEQKPAWSEEEKNILDDIIHDYEMANKSFCGYEARINWLKSLKDRIQPQPKQEWSEEDENNLDWLTTVCERIHYKSDPQVAPECALILKDWLNSLKDRYTWKPTEKQIKALEHFVRSVGESGYASPYDNDTKLVYSLLEQLKKLKG